MNDNHRKQVNMMAVNDKAFDLIAEIAAQEEMASALNEMAAVDAAGVSTEEAEALRRLDAYYGKRIEKHFRKVKIKRLLTQTLPKIGQAAAVFVAVIAVAGTVAVASSSVVRAKVMELLYTMEDEYTQVTLRENEAAAFDVPVEWGGEYYPAFIPEGLHVTKIESNALSEFVSWADSEETIRLHFLSESDTTLAQVDTEDAEIEYFEMGNFKDGMFITKGTARTVVWRIFDRFYILCAYDYDSETVMSIVESVQKIR